jgi:hypothetical protein
LVIPYHMANTLDSTVIAQVVDYVNEGGFILISAEVHPKNKPSGG